MSDKELDELVTNALKSGEWKEYKDEKTGRTYYYNKAQNKTTWDLKKTLTPTMKVAGLEKRDDAQKGPLGTQEGRAEGSMSTITGEPEKIPTTGETTATTTEVDALKLQLSEKALRIEALEVALKGAEAILVGTGESLKTFDCSVTELAASPSPAETKQRLLNFFKKYNPDKIDNKIDSMIALWSQRGIDMMFISLVKEYGKEPEGDPSWVPPLPPLVPIPEEMTKLKAHRDSLLEGLDTAVKERESFQSEIEKLKKILSQQTDEIEALKITKHQKAVPEEMSQKQSERGSVPSELKHESVSEKEKWASERLQLISVGEKLLEESKELKSMGAKQELELAARQTKIDKLQADILSMRDRHCQELARAEMEVPTKKEDASEKAPSITLSPPRPSVEVERLRNEVTSLKARYDTDLASLRATLLKEREAGGEGALTLQHKELETASLLNAQLYLETERRMMQEYVADYCEKCNNALIDAKRALEERAHVLETKATTLEYELRFQYKQREEDLAAGVHEQTSIVSKELQRMQEEHRLKMAEVEHQVRMERQRVMAEYAAKEQSLVEGVEREKAQLQEVRHQESIQRNDETKERLRIQRRLEIQMQTELENAAKAWEDFQTHWHRDCIVTREAMVTAVQQVQSVAFTAEKARADGLLLLETQLRRDSEQHVSSIKADAAAQIARIYDEHRRACDALEAECRTLQEEARVLRDTISRNIHESDARQSKRDAAHRHAQELWEAERDAERQHLETSTKRLRQALHEERNESRCAQQKSQTECDTLQQQIRELQTQLAAERTAHNKKECEMVVEIERARSDLAKAKRDDDIRALAMKEEIDQRVQCEVENFKRRYLELRDSQSAVTPRSGNTHIEVIENANDAVETSQNFRTRRLREWMTAAVPNPVVGSAAGSVGSHLSPRQLLEDACLIVPSGAISYRGTAAGGGPLSSRSSGGCSAAGVQIRPASDAYFRMQNLKERLKGKLESGK